MVRTAGVEPAACSFGGYRSLHLSYVRKLATPVRLERTA